MWWYGGQRSIAWLASWQQTRCGESRGKLFVALSALTCYSVTTCCHSILTISVVEIYHRGARAGWNPHSFSCDSSRTNPFRL